MSLGSSRYAETGALYPNLNILGESRGQKIRLVFFGGRSQSFRAGGLLLQRQQHDPFAEAAGFGSKQPLLANV